MSKRVMYLSKNDLRYLVHESINNILKEPPGTNDIIDISKIDIEILKSVYYDWRLTPTMVVFSDALSPSVSINESFGEVLPPDDIVKRIIKKYHLPKQLVLKREAYNKISIYVITALVGINDKLVEKDMEKAGYFLGYRQAPQTIDGMVFQVLQFEPTSQMQEDITEDIIATYDCLYHWTPEHSLSNIMEHGLIPSNSNKMFFYPPRTYLMKGDATTEQMKSLGKQLSFVNTDSKNTGDYVLLKIRMSKLDDDVRFYYDSNSDLGIYTEQKIPSDSIELLDKYKFKTQKD